MNDKAIDIFKIDGGKLGIVNINNMIPIPLECITDVFSVVDNHKYKELLEHQLTYLNDHKRQLFAKVEKFQKLYRKGYLSNKIRERCCDFPLLEEKCLDYNLIMA